MKSLEAARDRAEEQLRAYTDPSGPYAFRTYDASPLNTTDHLRPEDILAANLLSLTLKWHHVVPLYAAGEAPPQRLRTALDKALVAMRNAPAFEEIDSEEQLREVFEPLAEANRATQQVTGWTPVTVSKVLHRFAPHAVPIVDSRVRAFYGVRAGQEAELRTRQWRDIRQNLSWLEELAERYPRSDGGVTSVLRIADILIWTPDGESESRAI